MSMFEILMFLFENYMDNNAALKMDDQSLLIELERIGFDRFDISRALHWLNGLAQFKSEVNKNFPITQHPIRYYLAEETERLGLQGRGLLLYLEQLGILDPVTREMVIDRIMALDQREVDLGRIKWVVLMALFHQPERQSALALMQDIVLADGLGILH